MGMDGQNLSVPPELGRLSTLIDSHTECLAGPSIKLRSIALCATKHIFDWALETEESSKPFLRTLLATLTETAPPQTRSQARSAPSLMYKHPKKKISIQETPLPSLLIDGMTTDQIWQQLDLRAARVCENLQVLQGDDEDEDENKNELANMEGRDDNDVTEAEDEDDGAEMDVDDEGLLERLSNEDDDDSIEEGVIDLHEEISDDEDDDRPPTLLDVVRGQAKLSASRSRFLGHPTLDDGFFDLAAFNTETREVEAKKPSKKSPDPDEDYTEDSEMDLFSSLDQLETKDAGNGPELFYNDFFEPPQRVQNRSLKSNKVRFHERVSIKKIKAVGKGLPVSFVDDEDSDEEVEDN